MQIEKDDGQLFVDLEMLRKNLSKELYEKIVSESKKGSKGKKQQKSVRVSHSPNSTVIIGDDNTAVAQGASFSTTLSHYHNSLVIECDQLPLGIVDPRFATSNSIKSVSLSNIYIPIDALSFTKHLSKQKDLQAPINSRMFEQRQSLTAAIDDIKLNKILLLGETGSGKTSFVNFVTGYLASSHLSRVLSAKSLLENDSFYKKYKKRLIAKIILKNYMIHIHEHTSDTQIIPELIRRDAAYRVGKERSDELFERNLAVAEMQGGIIFLDGLDEIGDSDKARLIKGIEAFTSLYKKIKVILTSRTYVYSKNEQMFNCFSVLQLAPFNSIQINNYISNWYKIVMPMLNLDIDKAEVRSNQLAQTIYRQEHLMDMASRPLLLTLMVTLHTSWGQLPEDRAELYEESVKLLLTRWEDSRQSQNAEEKNESDIQYYLRTDQYRSIRSALERLAYETHMLQQGEDFSFHEPATISKAKILSAFDFLPDNINPRVLIRFLSERSGMLIALDNEHFAFPHRSYQEYLAACFLCNGTDLAMNLDGLLTTGIDWWREVCILAICKTRQGGLSNSVSLLSYIFPEDIERDREDQEAKLRKAIIIGQAFYELRIDDFALEQNSIIKNRVISWLVFILESEYLSSTEKLLAGDILGKIGDPRRGVNTMKKGKLEYPDISWICIPNGSFTMGSILGTEDEMPVHTVYLTQYHISQYPITNQQYRPFISAGGYDNPKYWTSDGWAWRMGEGFDYLQTSVIEYDSQERETSYVSWLNSRSLDRSKAPFWWEELPWNIPNRPVVGVNWFEAIAYCNWLNETLVRISDELIKPGFCVRLPTLAEWEKAARGVSGNEWPWGHQWEDNSANTLELGLKQTTSVGLFTKGISPFGLFDVAGNVYEWVSTRLGLLDQKNFGYPCETNDGRNDIHSKDVRFVKGSSWNFTKDLARCASNNWDYPVIFDQNTGFRVVISHELR